MSNYLRTTRLVQLHQQLPETVTRCCSECGELPPGETFIEHLTLVIQDAKTDALVAVSVIPTQKTSVMALSAERVLTNQITRMVGYIPVGTSDLLRILAHPDLIRLTRNYLLHAEAGADSRAFDQQNNLGGWR